MCREGAKHLILAFAQAFIDSWRSWALKYKKVCTAQFIRRPNRFIAEILLDGKETRCHVKNTGRCRELLVDGATVYIEQNPNPGRKTDCSLIAVRKGDRIVNIDSQAPNKVFYEALMAGKIRLPGFEEVTCAKPEKTYGASRFDFYIESGLKKAFIEVKGATLEEEGVAKFPDAPTERGIKHLLELVKAKEDGYSAFIVFIIQMQNIRYFTSNDRTHKAFGDTLRYASQNGVTVLAYECDVTPDNMELNGKELEVML